MATYELHSNREFTVLFTNQDQAITKCAMRIGCDFELSPYSISLNVSTERAGRKETGSAVGVLTRSLKRIKAMRKKSTKRISNSARRTKRNTLSTALVKSPGSSLLLPPPMPRWCRIAPGRSRVPLPPSNPRRQRAERTGASLTGERGGGVTRSPDGGRGGGPDRLIPSWIRASWA
jgi:hypothetical protein